MKKINNIVVEKIKTPFENQIIKHKNMFNNAYPNIFISAKKGSGKWT